MTDLVRRDERNSLEHARLTSTGVPEGYPSSTEPEQRGLREYLGIARRHPWIILAFTGVFTAFAAWLVMTAPPQYKANAVVRIVDTRRLLTGNKGEASGAEQMMSREADMLLSQIQILMSRQNVGGVVDAEGLRLVPTSPHQQLPQIGHAFISDSTVADTVRISFFADSAVLSAGGEKSAAPYGAPLAAGGIQLTVSARPSVAAAMFNVESRNDAIDRFLDSFKAIPRPKTDVVDLLYTSGDPKQASRVVNAMAFTFQSRNAQNAQQTSHRRRLFLESQIRQTDSVLQQAMAAYSNYRSGKQVFSSEIKGKAQQEGMVAVDLQRGELEAQRRTIADLLRQANGGNTPAAIRGLMAAPGLATNPVMKQLSTQIASLEAQHDSLLVLGAAATNPQVVAIENLIRTVSAKIVNTAQEQVVNLETQISAVRSVQSSSAVELAEGPRTETEEQRLSLRVETIQKMSDQLQQDYQQARMSEAVEVGQVEIIDLADIPSAPVTEGKTRKLALGIIIGLMLGMGAAVVRDEMNSSIRRRDDIERVLQVPGLAVIPQFASVGAAGAVTRMLPARMTSKRNGKGKRDRDTGLVTVYDNGSLGAEAYRTLRTNLIFSQAVHTLRSLVVTSAAPGEGKTTTAANLAVSFAQQGLRVLIVDCDLRRARLHKMFGIPREPGLTEFVIGQMDQDDVIREGGAPGLYVLASGQLPPNPAELLGGDKMRNALIALTGAFDLVILDTPPILAASDAAILSTLTDGVVLVVRAGVTEIEAGRQAVAQLTAVGARVVGAVLNDPDAKVQHYGGYYKYDYAS